MATLTSTCNTSKRVSQTLGNTKEFHDASFSSYITNAESIATQKLPESKQYTANTSTDFHSCKINSQRKMADGEISIFGAEKYFSGGMDEEHMTITEKSGGENRSMEGDDVDIQSTKLKFKPGARSTHSESSWNSRSALIPVLLENQSPVQRNKVDRKSIFSTFSWMCACSDKKCVEIDESFGEHINSRNRARSSVYGKESIKAPVHINVDPISSNVPVQTGITGKAPYQHHDSVSLGSQKDENFAFTVSKSVLANFATGKKQCEDKLEDGNARKSLDVFGSPILHKVAKTLSLDRKLNMFSWDVNSGSRAIQDDEKSDSSSDLFEIANLTEDIHPFFKRQTSAGMSSYATTTCYEPSEASIEWSVITASAVNFSTTSNYQEQVSKTVIPHTETATKTTCTKTTSKNEVQWSHPHGLLGCKSHNAARVAEEVYTVPEKSKTNSQRCHISNTLTTMTGFQIETGSRNYKRANIHHAPRACSVSKLHSGQASKSRYTQ